MDKLIKEIRRRVNMSQEQLAKALGTTALSINRWENNKTIPNNIAQAQLFSFCKSHNIDLFDFIVNQVAKKADSKNEVIVYHGSKKGLVDNIKPNSRIRCDFGKGFYTGSDPKQPLLLICDEEQPMFYSFKLNLDGLKVLKVDIGIDWAMLIAFHRGYLEEVKETEIYNKYSKMSEGYDVIVGYIANDRMYRVITSFFEKEITDAALINCLSSLDLGMQYVCKSEKACEQLKLIEETRLSSLELAILQEKSSILRDTSIKLTEETLLKYRREGKFFDELLKGI